jgi:5-methylcytosine-specific restriction endonuclease McrA
MESCITLVFGNYRFLWYNIKMRKCHICKKKLTGQKKVYCSLPCRNIGYKTRGIKPPSRKGYKYTEQERIDQCKRMSKVINSMKNPETVRKVQIAKKKRFDLLGRKTDVRQRIYNTEEYKNWRQQIFERDNFKCIMCSGGGYIEADHIKPLCIIIKENSIKDVFLAKECTELWDTKNGRTLCKKCHKATPTYGYKARSFSFGKNNDIIYI